MKTQLSKPSRTKARYTEEYKQEALEAVFARLGQFPARRVMRINFRDDEYALALTIDRVCHNFFRAAFAVHLGGVD